MASYPTQRTLRKRIYEHRVIYLMLFPAVIWYLIFCYYPMYGVLLAFKDFKYNLGIIGSPWIGFRYFEQFLNQSMFWQVMRNTVVVSALKIVFCFPAPIILALMLNEVSKMRYKRIIQTFSYLPHFVSWVVVVSLLMIMLSPYGGVVNSIRTQQLGLEPIFYLGEKEYFYPLVLLSDIWKGVGWGTIIYLSAITSINNELYEAAICDGAGRFRCMWHITIPGILPTIGILFILNSGNILNAGFDQILLLQQPSNLEISQILDTYVLKVGIKEGRFGFATAIGLFKSVFSIILVLSTNWISKRATGISVW